MSALDRLLRAGWLRCVDHALALAMKRLRPQTAEPVLIGAALASRALALGHSGLPLTRAAELFAEIAPEREPTELPDLQEWRSALRVSPWVATLDDRAGSLPQHDLTRGYALVFEHDRLYLRRYHDYEQRLAAALRQRCAWAPPPADPATLAWREARLAQLFPALAQDPSDAQASAARRLMERRLLLLSGGPGTGKTTTAARALTLLLDQARQAGAALPRIALAAPTGKAASRLAEAVRSSVGALRERGLIDAATVAALPSEAATLHRLLGRRPHTRAFLHDATHPLHADVVVVDEASMIDLPLMCKLVEAVAPHATLLLLGDRDQLPSVETGDVLAALCDAADGAGALAEHRVTLRRSWRQREGNEVGALAALVRQGRSEAAIEGLAQNAFRGVHWLPAAEPTPWAALQAQALPAYRAVQQAATPAQGLQLAQRFRVLTAVREGPLGSATLNAQFAQALQSPRARAEHFFHGALLIITENSYRHGLFNGDVGVVWREPESGDRETLRVWFERDGATHASGLRAWLPTALPAHELAFALTVHRAQGSEYEEVFLALPSGAQRRALSRELLYTGLTRCRQSLVLWAQADALRLAIDRRTQRWSGLSERLV